MIIGITGNSGSGKTSICETLEKKYNITIIDADEIVAELSMPQKQYFKEIVKNFGEDILLDNGQINKPKLASIIFSDASQRELLNSLTYKYVVEEIKKQVKENGNKITIIDAPLLIESKLNQICDIVISVIADEDVKIKRICKRDNIDKDIALTRIKAQPENDFYIKNSDYVIINNDNSNLGEQAKTIIELIEGKMIKSPDTIIIQDGDLRILQFKKLLEYKELVHAFTLKPLDFGSNDTYQKIKEEADSNYKSICKLLNIDSQNIIRPYQTHTNNIKEVNEDVRSI